MGWDGRGFARLSINLWVGRTCRTGAGRTSPSMSPGSSAKKASFSGRSLMAICSRNATTAAVLDDDKKGHWANESAALRRIPLLEANQRL